MKRIILQMLVGALVSASAHAQMTLTNELGGQPISGTTTKCVILIHGWNPDDHLNFYDLNSGFEWFNLLTGLKARLNGTGWSIIAYHWEDDAATGEVFDFNSSSWLFDFSQPFPPNQASANAKAHGANLATQLNDVSPNLREVHFIAHSAGSWAAREAMKRILQLNPYVVVQMTLLDPYIVDPSGVFTPDFSDNAMNDAQFFAGSERIQRLESYYADDSPSDGWNEFPWGSWVPPTLKTQEQFDWRSGIDITNRVDWGNSAYYDWHSGPIQFYSDCVSASLFPGSIPSGLQDPGCPFNYQQIGWNRSLFAWESLLPQITTQPANQFAQTGGSATFTVTANQATSYEWYKVGGGYVGSGSSLTLNSLSSGNAGSYVVRVSNVNGQLYSQPATLTVGAAPTAPSLLSAVAVSSSQINLTWLDVANETGYKIERRLAPSGAWSQITTRSANVIGFSDTGRAAGTAYSYRVRAYNAAGDSDYSPTASATTQPPVGTTYTLTIASSNPSSGVSVWSCGGSGGCVSSTTPTSRSFDSGTAVGIACPDTLAGGLVFQKWQLDGNDLAFTSTTAISMNGPHTLTAVFGAAPLPPKVLSSLTIEGPSSVDERSTAQYKARATYTDSSSAYVNAEWDDDTGYASISSTGLLDTDAVSSDRDIEIEATFTAGGVTKTRTKDVTIRNTDAVPTYTLTRNVVGNGEIGYSPQGSSFPADTWVYLHANDGDGYVFSHWSGDASGTEDDIYIVMDQNQSITAHFVVDTNYGNLRVNISPPQANAEGAAWKYDLFTSWRPSGDLQDGITPRINRYVHFKDIPGWITPNEFKASIIGGQTTVTNATYREILGAVQVTMSPAQAAQAGARWRLNGGAWREGGTTLADAPTGAGTIEFLTIPGWITPVGQAITIARGLTTTRSGDYGPPPGFPIITSVAPRTGPIVGGTTVTVEGANFQAGVTVTFGGVPATSVTVVSPTRITAVTPPRASYGTVPLALTSGGQTVTQANGFSYLNPLGSNIELVGQFGGNVEAVAVVGNLCYYGEGTSLVVMDFTNPGAPVERGRIALPAFVRDIAVSGNFAYVANSFAGLYAIDVSNPAAPSIVGFFDTEVAAQGVAVDGPLAYVADATAGVVILDVSNPAAISRAGGFPTPGFAKEVVVGVFGGEKYAFIAESDSLLRVARVTTPATASIVASIPVESASLIHDVKLVGTTLYCGDSQPKVKVFDVSNPIAPVQIGISKTVGAGYFDVVGNRLYTWDTDTRVVDLASASPYNTLGIFSAGGGCSKLVVSNGLAFAALRGGGLKVVSISNPASMSVRASIVTFSGTETVAVVGSTAFVGHSSGLTPFDVTNPARPVRLGDLAGARVSDMAITGSIATLVDYGSETVRVASIANPAAPSVMGTYTAIEAWSVGALGSTPLVVGRTKGAIQLPLLDVLSLASPSNPQRIGFVTLDAADNAPADSIATAGSWAFIGRTAHLDVVDLSNPNSPQKLGSVQFASNVGEVAASADASHVYVTTPDGIQVVDVSVKSSPVLGQLIDPPQNPLTGFRSVSVVGTRLYADENGFIYVFDISSPASPQVIAFYDTPGGGAGIGVNGDLIFVADGNAGVSILRLKDVNKPTVAITSPTANTAYSTNAALLTLGGVASDDKGAVRASWENNRGGGGVANGTTNWQVPTIQLAAGVNIITVTAEDANGNLATDTLTVTANLPDVTLPVVTITGPKPDDEFVVETNLITLSGSAVDNQSVTNLTWSNDRGGSGAMNLAGQNWSVTNLLLEPGPNLVQVTATDSSGNIASDTAVIFFVPPDTNAPSISIEFPTLNSVYETESDTLNLSGMATDNSSVAKVEWSSDHGGQGVASGVAPWSVNDIPLQPGLNVIEVAASDAAGNTATDALSVIYTPPPLRLNALGMSNGIFRLELSGPPITCVIQVSSNLVNWLPLSTNTIPVEGSMIVSDPGASNRPVRFYRAVSLAAATSSLPTLSATRLGSELLLSWPTNFTGFTLETATNLPPSGWTTNSVSPAIVNGQYLITNTVSGGRKFYRLRK